MQKNYILFNNSNNNIKCGREYSEDWIIKCSRVNGQYYFTVKTAYELKRINEQLKVEEDLVSIEALIKRKVSFITIAMKLSMKFKLGEEYDIFLKKLFEEYDSLPKESKCFSVNDIF